MAELPQDMNAEDWQNFVKFGMKQYETAAQGFPEERLVELARFQQPIVDTAEKLEKIDKDLFKQEEVVKFLTLFTISQMMKNSNSE